MGFGAQSPQLWATTSFLAATNLPGWLFASGCLLLDLFPHMVRVLLSNFHPMFVRSPLVPHHAYVNSVPALPSCSCML